MAKEPDFVSRQTYDARRFYLDLQPSISHPLTVVCGGVERMNEDYVVERNDFPFFAIEWVSEGNGLLTMGGKRYELSVGTLFAYGPSIAHRIENVAPTNMQKYYIDLAGPEAASSLKGLGLLEGRPVSIGRSYELVELWNLLDREARDGAPHTAKLCESLVRVLFQKIAQRIVSSEPGELPEAFHTFEAIRQMMIDRFMEFPTIEDAAVAGGISPVYLSRLFKRFGGCGAYRFLLRLRMNYAAELLMEQGLKVVEVAEQLKYADAFQFSRAFKRVYGIPPSKLSMRQPTSAIRHSLRDKPS
jgi:AraC family transcriptional regulator, arabinose operon regulatory protein